MCFSPPSSLTVKYFIIKLSYFLPSVTICSADQTTTSAAPTTHVTTDAPVTNSTFTTSLPPTTPTPTLPTPSTWTYNVTIDNTTVCLLAKFGLRLGFKQEEVSQFPLTLNHNHPDVLPQTLRLFCYRTTQR